jgi:hypothetical protein
VGGGRAAPRGASASSGLAPPPAKRAPASDVPSPAHAAGAHDALRCPIPRAACQCSRVGWPSLGIGTTGVNHQLHIYNTTRGRCYRAGRGSPAENDPSVGSVKSGASSLTLRAGVTRALTRTPGAHLPATACLCIAFASPWPLSFGSALLTRSTTSAILRNTGCCPETPPSVACLTVMSSHRVW